MRGAKRILLCGSAPPDAEISTFASAALFYSGCLSLVRVVFQMSKNTDWLPCRNAEWKYSSVPSNERDGFPSKNGLLITGPPCAWFPASKLAGVPHGSELLARVE